jgi:hypothetical protein
MTRDEIIRDINLVLASMNSGKTRDEDPEADKAFNRLIVEFLLDFRRGVDSLELIAKALRQKPNLIDKA